MLKKLVFLAILVVLIGAAAASAAYLPFDGGVIQYGQDLDLVCDSDGIEVRGWGWERDDHSVSSVQFIGIDPNCAGKMIATQLFAGSTELVYHYATLPSDPDDIDQDFIWTVPFGGKYDAQTITGLKVVVINSK